MYVQIRRAKIFARKNLGEKNLARKNVGAKKIWREKFLAKKMPCTKGALVKNNVGNMRVLKRGAAY
jgi:hypothetical protein